MKSSVFSKTLRGVFVPPVGALLLLSFLRFGGEGRVLSVGEWGISLVCLAGIPLLAYPVARAVPIFAAGGRRMSRTLAVAFSCVGYFGGWLYAQLLGGRDMRFLFTAYLCSAILLALANVLLGFRASGHATSLTGPVLFAGWYLGILPAFFLACLWGVVFWASLAEGRHTAAEYLGGSAIATLSFALSLPVYFLL